MMDMMCDSLLDCMKSTVSQKKHSIHSLEESSSHEHDLRKRKKVSYVQPSGNGYSQFQEKDNSQDSDYHPSYSVKKNNKKSRCKEKEFSKIENGKCSKISEENRIYEYNLYNLRKLVKKICIQGSGTGYSQFPEQGNSQDMNYELIYILSSSDSNSNKCENKSQERDGFKEQDGLKNQDKLQEQNNSNPNKCENRSQERDSFKEQDGLKNQDKLQEQNNSQEFIYLLSSPDSNAINSEKKPQEQDAFEEQDCSKEQISFDDQDEYQEQNNSQEMVSFFSSLDTNAIDNIDNLQGQNDVKEQNNFKDQEEYQEKNNSQESIYILSSSDTDTNTNSNEKKSQNQDKLQKKDSHKEQDQSQKNDKFQDQNNSEYLIYITSYVDKMSFMCKGKERSSYQKLNTDLKNNDHFKVKRKKLNLSLRKNDGHIKRNVITFEGKELNLINNSEDKANFNKYNAFPYLEKLEIKAGNLKHVNELEFPNLKILYIDVRKVGEKQRKILNSKIAKTKELRQTSLEEIFSKKEQRKLRNQRLKKECQKAAEERKSKINKKELIIQLLTKLLLKNLNLETFSLSYYEIENLPSALWNLKKLKCLIIKKLGLSSISEDIKNLVNLEILGLSNNKLTELPEEIECLTNLKELSLIGNDHLIKFPKVISKLSNLQVININQAQKELWEESLQRLENENKNLKIDI
ncbi:hypothetical protein PIROE2DRAFT_65085 [Piromyces sp. E2]|nr:hypothetical protein PIROE2DRAFT_65085 [Piromyces sp. E2]|eukprot:OUM57288.1 hypothetical protein PIROE2DRAFT_65085 [Piromyces sp. E2]